MMAMKLNSLLKLLAFSLFFSASLSKPRTQSFVSISPEFSALLAFKTSSDPSNSLSSWSNSSTSDPCSAWLGVTCHPATHRVIKLVLNHLNLTGTLDLLSQLTQLRHLSLHHNQLSSTPNFTYWPNLKHLYLSHNAFTGEIPAEISQLRRLRRVDLSFNSFSGEIPISELTQLPHLLTLRLEFNKFAGTLGPNDKFQLATSISDFNVSGNNLTGKIPQWLSKFPISSFTGNINLCGRPLPSACSRRTGGITDPTAGDASSGSYNGILREKKRGLSGEMMLMIIGLDALAVTAAIATLTWCCFYKRKCYSKQRRRKKEESKKGFEFDSQIYSFGKDNKLQVHGSDHEDQHHQSEMICFEGCKGFSKVDDLLRASAEMMGKGSVGTTYKVVMEGGDVVVVKRVREISRMKKRMREVEGLLREIGCLRHQNVVSLRAYYSTREELLLVYDFLPNGSLYNLLHGNRGPGRTPLDWTTRLKVAAGTAGGLASLHAQNHKTKLSHGHLTSSNIIIDHQGNACISDIGLHQLLQAPSSPSDGYKAPELLADKNGNAYTNTQSRRFSHKSDVYSFGVILLEILTGKMATSEGKASLANWVQRVVSKEWTWDVFDFELARYRDMEGEMVELLKVAMLCLASSPKDRPKMSEVHKTIEEIRTKENRGRAKGSPWNEQLNSDTSSLAESTPNFTSS